MALCDGAHALFDRHVDGPVQVGELPRWTRVHGSTVWTVHRGPYPGLAAAWDAFHRKVGEARPGTPDGPPGEIYICNPQDHAGADSARMLTLLYLPLQ